MRQIAVHYIQSCKSIEQYSLNGKTFFIYNNNGLYFDVFFSQEKMRAFFDNKVCRGDLFFL